MVCYLYLKPNHFNINQSLQCYQVSFVLQRDRKFFLMADLSLVLKTLHILPVHFVEVTTSSPTISPSHLANPHKIPNEKNNKQIQNIKHSLCDLFPSSLFCIS